MRFEGRYECFDDDGKPLGTIIEVDPGDWLFFTGEKETTLTTHMLRSISDKVEALDAAGLIGKHNA